MTAARTRGRPRKSKSDPEYLYGEGIRIMVLVKTERATIRWRNQLLRAEAYSFPKELKITKHMEDALEAMNRAVAAIAKVPLDWKPAVGAVGGQLIEVGSSVQIRQEHKTKYFFITDVHAPLKVESISGSQIMCIVRGNSGLMTTVFPKAHIRLTREDD